MVLGFLKGFNVNGKRKLTNFEEKIKKAIKLHTIRWDEKGRWRKGMKIHFATGARTNNYNNFKMGVCTGVQEIEIIDRMVMVDGEILSDVVFNELVTNDGFDSVEDFWGWFDSYSPFTGKLIHWTELRYNQDY